MIAVIRLRVIDGRECSVTRVTINRRANAESVRLAHFEIIEVVGTVGGLVLVIDQVQRG